ncbi:restriction endonuclease subunit S [Patescibacteria group bacterium]|nr:restriction endonuclease subunit S [Patescibacteria group bacterium]
MIYNKLKFKQFITLQRGFDLPVTEMKDGEVPVLGSTGVIGYHNKAKLNSPGVVTGRSGTIGVIQYTDKPYWPHNTSLWVKDFKSNHPKFVYYKMKTLYFERFNGGASVPTLNRNNLDNLTVQIPDAPIQEAIANILSVYDDLIDNNRRRIQLLEESARLLFREWFVYFRFQGHEKVKIVDGVPEGWKREKINSMISILGGYAFKSTTYKPNGKYGIVTIKNVQQSKFIPQCTDYIDEPPNAMKHHCLLANGDILLSLTGNVGRVCLVYGENYLLNQRVAKIVPKKTIPKSYAYWLFDNSVMQKRIDNLSHGAAQQNLSPIKLGNQTVILPPIELLKMFDDAVSLINAETITLLQQNQKLTQARDLLLPRLMSGAIEV